MARSRSACRWSAGSAWQSSQSRSAGSSRSICRFAIGASQRMHRTSITPSVGRRTLRSPSPEVGRESPQSASAHAEAAGNCEALGPRPMTLERAMLSESLSETVPTTDVGCLPGSFTNQRSQVRILLGALWLRDVRARVIHRFVNVRRRERRNGRLGGYRSARSS
jgi:hypothetical protein